jgi:hypothetical protein
MLVKNVFDIFSAPCFAFFGKEEPQIPPAFNNDEEEKQYDEKLAEYNKEKESFLTLMEVSNLKDVVALKFSLCSVVFDLINSAINQKVYVMPESPKLLKRIEKSLVDFAQIADNDEEIDIPDAWLPIIDKLFNDDVLFGQVALHGEISSVDSVKKALPVRARVLMTMKNLNEALLNILPA